MFTKILIAVDGSELGFKALDVGLSLARDGGTKAYVMTASEPVTTALSGAGGFGAFDAGAVIAQLEQSYAEEAKAILEKVREKATIAGIEVEPYYIAEHRPADAIIASAEQYGCDLIVMGSHGRRGLQRLLLGSQAAEVLARASIPVLVVK